MADLDADGSNDQARSRHLYAARRWHERRAEQPARLTCVLSFCRQSGYLPTHSRLSSATLNRRAGQFGLRSDGDGAYHWSVWTGSDGIDGVSVRARGSDLSSKLRPVAPLYQLGGATRLTTPLRRAGCK